MTRQGIQDNQRLLMLSEEYPCLCVRRSVLPELPVGRDDTLKLGLDVIVDDEVCEHEFELIGCEEAPGATQIVSNCVSGRMQGVRETNQACRP
jgi:hypothetical protein